MTSSPESTTFTNTILSTVRLQRHLGVRILIATQEPSVSPSLLDLCSVTIIHSFTSPAWLRTLHGRTAAYLEFQNDKITDGKLTKRGDIFQTIVQLGVGEALIFAPNATLCEDNGRLETADVVLGRSYLKVKVRMRLSSDGGKSLLAN